MKCVTKKILIMSVQKNDRELPTNMSSLSEVLEKLKERGLDTEFRYKDGAMHAFGNTYTPQELSMIRTFRFEGFSDPADNVAVYMVEDKDTNIGYIMDVYGSESNYGEGFNEFLKNIPVQTETPD